jgi:1,4-dihydroxy-2-naphthoate octaprenyltransferase
VATAAQWLSAARPRTLPAAISPVLVGTGAAAALGRDGSPGLSPVRAVLAMVVALALQVGVNYANDYSDGIRGTDDDRVGPFRLTASGAARPVSVRSAAFAAFGVAAAAGLALIAASGAWPLLAVGAGAIAAAWYYTGGSRPYGYAGLGEVFVFVFFGLVAVLGTTYTQAGRIGAVALAGAVATGALACAILVANNLRDVPTDAIAGKHTLAVRLGDGATRRLYLALVVVALLLVPPVAVAHPWTLLALAAVPVSIPPVRAIRAGATGRALLPVLRDTGRLELAYALLFGLGLLLG